MLIRMKGVHKSFGQNHVLRGVNLEVERGYSLVILGGSGSGKSVLLRHLVGLQRPDRGCVQVDGNDLGALSKKELYQLRRRFGMSFQEGALFDSLNAFENVAFPIRRMERQLSEGEVRKRVDACLEMVGMPGVGKLMPSEMSGGMRRRIGFARAVALQPEILLFDEPTTGLDPIMTSVLNEVIIGLRERLKATTITITHDIGSAKHIANHLAMLFQGEIILHAETETFFETEDEIVRQFLEGRSEGPATESLFK